MTTLFDDPEPHARFTDPISSDLCVKSLGRDDSLKWDVLRALVTESARTMLRHYSDGDSIAVLHDQPVTDDDLVDWLERHHQRRFQRNVIARTRGLLEPGWVQRVGMVTGRTGRPTICFVPTTDTITLIRSNP